MRALITEDDFIARRVLELFLLPYGSIMTAASGEEALQLFLAAHERNEPFDLICLDIGLPGQRGIEVLQEIRSIEKDQKIGDPVAVLMLTGASDEKKIAAARELGASRYVLKPVIETELLGHLKDIGII